MTGNGLIRRGSAVEGGFAYAGAVVAFLLVSLVASLIPAGEHADLVSYIATAVLQVCFFLAAFIPYKAMRSRPRYTYARPTVKACLGGGAVTLVCLVAFYGLTSLFSLLLWAVGYEFAGSTDLTSPLGIVFSVLITIVLAPVCEEKLFRSGYLSSLEVLFGRAKSERRQTLSVICMCGLAFALIHARPEQTVYQFFFGAALAYLTIRTKSVFPAMIAHALNNSVGLVLSVPAVSSGMDAALTAVAGGWYFVLLFAVVSVGLAAGGVFALRRLINALGDGRPEQSFRTEGEHGFKNYADDGGSLACGVFSALALVACAALWIFNLVAGLVA